MVIPIKWTEMFVYHRSNKIEMVYYLNMRKAYTTRFNKKYSCLFSVYYSLRRL